MTIARVFPSGTSMTPKDALAFINCDPPKKLPIIDAVHVSVTFSWDIPRDEQLAEKWLKTGVPVEVGGRAFRKKPGEFVPGMYVKQGMTITSRGCDNNCWFCDAWKIEGPIRELPIQDGWNVLDNNLLGCSDDHVTSVFEMLGRQPRRPVFSGGLEARVLKPWHAAALKRLHPGRMYFAYDTANDLEPLIVAGKIMHAAGHTITSHRLCCYVLIGYPGDTFSKAETRLVDTIKAGFFPYAMLYRDTKGDRDPDWMRFQRGWLRPAIVGSKIREFWKNEIEPALAREPDEPNP